MLNPSIINFYGHHPLICVEQYLWWVLTYRFCLLNGKDVLIYILNELYLLEIYVYYVQEHQNRKSYEKYSQ